MNCSDAILARHSIRTLADDLEHFVSYPLDDFPNEPANLISVSRRGPLIVADLQSQVSREKLQKDTLFFKHGRHGTEGVPTVTVRLVEFRQ
jgi:hypothetical protein